MFPLAYYLKYWSGAIVVLAPGWRDPHPFGVRVPLQPGARTLGRFFNPGLPPTQHQPLRSCTWKSTRPLALYTT